jgi:transketolase
MTDFEHLKRIASQVRRDIVRMVHARQSGHPGGSLGCTDLMTILYFDHLRIKAPAFKMNGEGEDIFFLSNGHISPVFYSVLARRGYFPISELATFRAIESRLQGHPTTHEGLPGVRMSSGSLGQGLSVAIGAANAKKLNKDEHLVYVLMGDGEQQEGQVWEAAMYAGSRKIDNLIAMIDYNHKQIDGPVDEVMPLGDLKAKYEAFGWKVSEVDGNDMEALSELLKNCQNTAFQGFPQIILMKTEMGQGVDFMMGTHKWHGVAPNDEQLEKALSQLEETLGDY